MRAGTLYLRLPSGRELAYPEARIDVRGWHGTFCENVVQAVSRDLLAEAMRRVETAGYPIHSVPLARLFAAVT
jgi:hypothetical protein